MRIRIISGGQTGVDQAALFAAAEAGLPTGGYMPRGWTTQDGPRPEFEDVFGMFQHFSPKYAPRTEFNVGIADFTIAIAKNFNSPGEICTAHACAGAEKTLEKIHWDGTKFSRPTEEIAECIAKRHALYWKCQHKDYVDEVNSFVVNFAGNSERTARGIHDAAFAYLVQVFTQVKPLIGMS